MKKSLFARALCALALSVAVPLAVHAQDAGLTDKEIVIGLFAPLSGPLANLGSDALNAARAYYEDMNAKGGIHGRKIRVVVGDDKCTPNETNTVARKFVNVDKVFLIHGGTCSGAAVSIQEFVTREKVPYVMLNAAGDAAAFPPTRYTFTGFAGTQAAIATALAGFAIDNLKAKRIGYVIPDDNYGQKNHAIGKRIADKAGVQIVALEAVPTSATDLTATALNLRAANPDVIVSAMYPPTTVLLLQKMEELGMTMPFVETVSGVPVPATFAKNVGSANALKNFYYSIPFVDLYDSPSQTQWLDLFKRHNPGQQNPGAYVGHGVASAMTITKALEAVGPQLTREKFIDAMESVNLNSGVMATPIQFNKNRRDAMRGQRIVKFDGTTTTLMPGTWIWDGQP